MSSELRVVLLVAVAMVVMAAIRWVDPYWPICWMCLDYLAAHQGRGQ